MCHTRLSETLALLDKSMRYKLLVMGVVEVVKSMPVDGVADIGTDTMVLVRTIVVDLGSGIGRKLIK